jgi:hypothetical protein
MTCSDLLLSLPPLRSPPAQHLTELSSIYDKATNYDAEWMARAVAWIANGGADMPVCSHLECTFLPLR